MSEGGYLPRAWLFAWTAVVVVFILAPFVAITLVSVTATAYVSLPTRGVSLRWYAALGEQRDFITAALNSVRIAVQASVTSLVVGTLASLAIVRYTFRLRHLVNVLATSPLFIPMILSGLAILLFFSSLEWSHPSWRLYAGHTVITLPYVVRTVTASLAGFDINQELAARNLGASALKAFWHVTVPQIGPGVLAAALFAFIVSFDNVGISIFLVGPRFDVLPVSLYAYAAYNNDPLASAMSVVLILGAVAAVAVLERVFGLQRLLQA